MRWPWQREPAGQADEAYQQAPRLSSAFLPQMPEGCTCIWDLARNGRPARAMLDPACQADHEGRRDPRQRMRGLRK